MKRPMTFITLFLCLGIITGYYFANMVSLVMVFIGVFLLNCFLYLKSEYKFTLILYLFFILGYILITNETKIDLENEHFVKGYVYDVQETNYSTKMFVNIESIDDQIIDAKVILTTYDKTIDKYAEILCEVDFEELNKETFEYNYYKSKNILYKGYVDNIEILGYRYGFRYYLDYISNKISDVYDNIFPNSESEIVKALVLGDKENLDDHIKNIYKIGGIFHILSLSGLHIAILSAFLMYIIGFLTKGNKKNIIVIIFLLFYLALTGGSISTTRAVIMASCVLIAPCLRREYDIISSISLACFIILIFRPFSLFNVSFILTFLSVFSITIISPKIKSIINCYYIKTDNFILKYLDKESELLAPAISIFLILTVVLAYYFYYFYPYVIFVNVIVAPFIAPLVILSFICGILGLFSINLASFIGASVYYILLFLEFICNIFAKLPFSQILVGKPTSIFIIFYFSIVFIIFFKNKSKIRYLLVSVVLFTILFISDNNKTKIQILTNQVFINGDEIVLLDTETKNTYTNEQYILSKGNDSVSTIVTDSVENTLYFWENNMLDTVYIKSNNENLEILKQNEIFTIVEIKDNEKFIIDNKTYFIDDNNIYMYDGNFSFSNIKNFDNVYTTDVQNVIDYGILVNNKNISKNISTNKENIKINFNNDKIIIR